MGAAATKKTPIEGLIRAESEPAREKSGGRMDNHGHALVTIPEGVTTRPRHPNKRPNEMPKQEQQATLLIEALRDHIETLKADLALARDQATQAIEAHQRLAVKLAKLKASRKKR